MDKSGGQSSALNKTWIGGVFNLKQRPRIGERILSIVLNLSGTRLVDSLQSRTKTHIEDQQGPRIGEKILAIVYNLANLRVNATLA